MSDEDHIINESELEGELGQMMIRCAESARYASVLDYLDREEYEGEAVVVMCEDCEYAFKGSEKELVALCKKQQPQEEEDDEPSPFDY